ncbi:hypothetical protein JZ751_010232 [Albula glossodonta]|uniref:Secreted protein n=1 Tax=Albula glossodonta TaxID=121402 RepID=A0A8T2MSB1_9TELE|nr:hypothetical protein JZ751_010232 [Albula glossodonta]
MAATNRATFHCQRKQSSYFFLLALGLASCLCGSAPCLLCGCCPSSNNSTITRLVFSPSSCSWEHCCL